MARFAPVKLSAVTTGLWSGKRDLLAHVGETCDRLETVEPEVLALVPEAGRRERLMADACALLAAWPDPVARPPLFGALLGVKDIFSADGFATRAGSRLPPALFDMPEGPAVKALKRAGCLVLGKTVTTEFAYFSPGPTRNPWDPDRTPGGSSSGSAAAVAAGFCPLALGTQTIGSISRPAAFCGVAGYKPSYGRVSRDGLVAFAPSLDHVGLFTAGAADLAMAAAALVPDWNCSATRNLEELPALAVPAGPYLEQAEPAAQAAFRATVEALRRRGCRVVEVPAFPDIADINARHRRIAAGELARVHARWFRDFAPQYAETTADLIRRGQAVDDAQLERDRTGQGRLRAELDALLSGAGARCWLSPAAPGPAPRGLSSTGDPVMNLPWTHAGVPTLVVPSGAFLEGMPLGLQLAAGFGRDEELLADGARIERLLQGEGRSNG